MPSWIFLALASAVFAAATGIFAKIGLATVPSDLATLIRTLVVVALAGLVVAVGGDWRAVPDISARGWGFLVLSGLATGASWLCWFRAAALGDVARIAPIDKLSVVFLALLSTTLLGEQLSMRAWIGVALVAVGAVLAATG